MKIIGSIITLTLVSLSLWTQDVRINPEAFIDGEVITYKVYYNWKFVWIPAGEVTFSTKENDDHYELNVIGRSYPSYDSFFKVRDDYVSRVDKNELMTINFRRHVLEGTYQRYDSISFDQKHLKVKEYFGKEQDKVKKYNFEFESNVLDIVSAIYYMRGLKLEEMEEKNKVKMPVFFDKELLLVNVWKEGEEKKKTKTLDKMNSIHMQVELLGGNIFKDGDVMDVWVTEDGQIPIAVESPLKVGSVKAVLKSVEGRSFDYNFKS